jgi:sodium/potassium-transporting ATPase subunit alpha
MTLTRDIETQQLVKPSFVSNLIANVKTPFSRNYWKEKFASTEAETLVDAKLLSYAYLEAGVIEMLGAYVHRLSWWACSDVFPSLVAYFVVFYNSGFSPYDLRVAQQAGGELPMTCSSNPLTRFVSVLPR